MDMNYLSNYILSEYQRCDSLSSITIDGFFIKWLGNAGFMLKGNDMVLYFDPYGLSGDIPEEDKADLLLITHEKFGHCEPDSIRKVRKTDCTTLIPERMSLQFRGDARRIMAGDSLTGELSIKGIDIEVVPAYDSCEDNGSSGAGVGYFLLFGELSIYHAGHTCDIPERLSASPDIVLLPIEATQGMDETKAADAVALISPKIVIPMGYVPGEGTMADPELFSDLVKEKSPSTEVIIL